MNKWIILMNYMIMCIIIYKCMVKMMIKKNMVNNNGKNIIFIYNMLELLKIIINFHY